MELLFINESLSLFVIIFNESFATRSTDQKSAESASGAGSQNQKLISVVLHKMHPTLETNTPVEGAKAIATSEIMTVTGES